MRKWLLAAAAAAIFIAPVAATAQAPIVIKFSHVVAPNTPKGKGADKFKELAEKYTNGKVKVEVYPNSTLYKDKEELEALQLGAVQMLAPSNSQVRPARRQGIRGVRPAVSCFRTRRRCARSPTARSARSCSSSSSQGHHRPRLLGQRLQGDERQQAAAHAGGLQGPEDAHPVLEGAGSADARARRDPAGDGVLGSLSGAADRRRRRQENTPSNVYTQKMHEVQKYTTLTNHGYIGYAVIVNKKFWDGLPADIRAQLEKAMKEATVYSNDIAAEGKRRSAGRDEEVRQDRDHHSDRSRKRSMQQGAGAGLSGMAAASARS